MADPGLLAAALAAAAAADVGRRPAMAPVAAEPGRLASTVHWAPPPLLSGARELPSGSSSTPLILQMSSLASVLVIGAPSRSNRSTSCSASARPVASTSMSSNASSMS
eukprot:363234-Chlamydomonas_euryale.AAC.6